MKCRNNCNLNIYKGLNKDRNDDNSVLEHSLFFTVTVTLKRGSPLASVRVCVEKDAIFSTPLRRT
jgi:hypothetical protein